MNKNGRREGLRSKNKKPDRIKQTKNKTRVPKGIGDNNKKGERRIATDWKRGVHILHMLCPWRRGGRVHTSGCYYI